MRKTKLNRYDQDLWNTGIGKEASRARNRWADLERWLRAYCHTRRSRAESSILSLSQFDELIRHWISEIYNEVRAH